MPILRLLQACLLSLRFKLVPGTDRQPMQQASTVMMFPYHHDVLLSVPCRWLSTMSPTLPLLRRSPPLSSSQGVMPWWWVETSPSRPTLTTSSNPSLQDGDAWMSWSTTLVRLHVQRCLGCGGYVAVALRGVRCSGVQIVVTGFT